MRRQRRPTSLGLGWRLHRHQDGATSTEYLGIQIFVAAVVLLLVLASGLGEQILAGVQQAICSVTGTGCPGPQTADRLGITCTTRTVARNVAYHLTVKSIRGEGSAGDQIRVFGGDEGAEVTTTEGNSLGLQGTRGARAAFDRRLGRLDSKFVSGRMTLGQAHSFVYGFDPEIHDDPEQAAIDFLDSRRGPVMREVMALTGTNGAWVEQWYDAVRRFQHDRFGWGEERASPIASSHRVEGVIRGEGGVGRAATGEIEGSGNLGGGGEIVVDWTDWTTSFVSDWGGAIGGVAHTPYLGSATGESGYRRRHIVDFDRDGNPTGYTLVTERDLMGGMQVGGRLKDQLNSLGFDEAGITGSGTSTSGQRIVESRFLDLTDPDNLAAFREGYHTPGGLIAVPRPGQRDALDDRLDHDALESRTLHHVDGSGWGAGGNVERSGGDAGAGVAYGGGRTASSTTTTLRNAVVRDLRTGTGWQPLRTCD